MADGGYSAFDAHLMAGLRNQRFGYSYPEWYSGSVDSPAKIAQQLLKYGLRKQRLQQQHNQSWSAPLLQVPNSDAQFTILDEPRFLGFGKVDSLTSREAQLSCSFNEAIDQNNVSFIHKNKPPNLNRFPT